LSEATGGNIEQMSRFFSSTEALNTVMSLTSEGGMTVFNTALDDMKTRTGQTQEAFDAFAAKDPSFAWRQLKAEIEVLLVKLGDALLPVLQRVVSAVEPIIKSVIDWVTAHKDLAAGIMEVAGGLGLFMLAVGPILIALPGIVSLCTILSGVGGFLGLGTAATSVIGVAGAAGAGTGLLGVGGGLAAIAVAAGPAILAVVAVAGALTAGLYAYNQYSAAQAQLEQSTLALAATTNRYADSMAAQGVELDKAKMAEMDLDQQREYIAQQTTARDMATMQSHFESITGRAASEQELTQAMNLALNDRLTAEDAARIVSMGYSAERLTEIMKMNEQETAAFLESIGIRQSGEMQANAALEANQQQHLATAEEQQQRFAELASGLWQTLGNTISAATGQQISEAQTSWGSFISGLQSAWSGFLSWFKSNNAPSPPSVPGGGQMQGAARGGTIASPGFVQVGEKGPEIVWLPQNAQVIPNASSGGRPSVNTTITFSGPVNVRTDQDIDSLARQIARNIEQTMITAGA
jgi:hypothetical protein